EVVRGLPGRGAEATVLVLGAEQVRDGTTRRGRRARARRRPQATGEARCDQHGDHRSDGARWQPPALEPPREALDRSRHRWPEREREGEAGSGMDRVEAETLADVDAELLSTVVAVRDPIAHVLDDRERKPGQEADDRKRPAPDPGLVRERGLACAS